MRVSRRVCKELVTKRGAPPATLCDARGRRGSGLWIVDQPDSAAPITSLAYGDRRSLGNMPAVARDAEPGIEGATSNVARGNPNVTARSGVCGARFGFRSPSQKPPSFQVDGAKACRRRDACDSAADACLRLPERQRCVIAAGTLANQLYSTQGPSASLADAEAEA